MAGIFWPGLPTATAAAGALPFRNLPGVAANLAAANVVEVAATGDAKYGAAGPYSGVAIPAKDPHGFAGDVWDQPAMTEPDLRHVGYNFLRDVPPDYHQRLAGGLPLGLDFRTQQQLRKRTENMIAMADQFNFMIERNWGRMIGDLEVRKLYDPQSAELENQLIRWRKAAEQMRANFLESAKELQAVKLQMTEADRRARILGQYHQRLMDSMRALGNANPLPLATVPLAGGTVLDQLHKYSTAQKLTFIADVNAAAPGPGGLAFNIPGAAWV